MADPALDPPPTTPAPLLITARDGDRLLSIAWAALRAHWDGLPPPGEHALLGGSAAGGLAAERGVFVTWKTRQGRDERLRGCIGYVSPHGPLWRAVRDLAVTAAVRDGRFSPVDPSEEPLLQVSVSVLTPAAPIAPEAVEVGRHGLIIERGSRRGLLLPQVAVEHGFDRTSFIERTCEKAGLDADAWRREGTNLFAFEAQVFGEAVGDGEGSAGGARAGEASSAGAAPGG